MKGNGARVVKFIVEHLLECIKTLETVVNGEKERKDRLHDTLKSWQQMSLISRHGPENKGKWNILELQCPEVLLVVNFGGSRFYIQRG